MYAVVVHNCELNRLDPTHTSGRVCSFQKHLERMVTVKMDNATT